MEQNPDKGGTAGRRVGGRKTHWMRYLFPLCVLLPAHAEETAFSRMLSDPAGQKQVVRIAARSTVMLRNPCVDARFDVQKNFVIYKPPAFDARGAIVSGAWKAVVNENGCATSRVLNVMVWAQSPGSLASAPLLPGSTHADPTLQKDAVHYATLAASLASAQSPSGAQERDCRSGYIADTSFVETEDITLQGAKGPSWRELWTLVGCTHRLLVPMHFVPDPTGTTISAGPPNAVKILPLDDGTAL